MTEEKVVNKNLNVEDPESMSLTAREVLDLVKRSHEVSLQQAKTEAIKHDMEKLDLNRQILLLRVEINKLQHDKKRYEMRDHGSVVMSKEKSFTKTTDEIKARYGFSPSARMELDEDTFEVDFIEPKQQSQGDLEDGNDSSD